MQYIANKTVTRYLNSKSTVIIQKGKSYSKEQVDTMPAWYLTDGYLTTTN